MTAIRKKLIEEIKDAPESTIKELYRLHVLVKEENKNGMSWSALTSVQKEAIENSLKELSEGNGIAMKKAMSQLTKKYGLA